MPHPLPAPTKSFQKSARSRWTQFKAFLFPREAENDPAFRREIERLSVRSLYIIAGVSVGMPALSFVFHMIANLFEPLPHQGQFWAVASFALVALGLLTAARTGWGRRHARPIALLSGFCSAMILTWSRFLSHPKPEEAELVSLASVVVVLLVGVVSIPAWPVQIFALGSVISACHWGSAELAVHWQLIPEVSMHNYAGMDLVTLLCTVLAGVNYHRIHETYVTYQRSMADQSRLLLSENAASMGRFAAALSHELNTPAGALQSSLDSMDLLAAKVADASDEQRSRWEQTEVDLRRTARASAESLQEIVRKMQRLTNLDRAEIISLDLNDLLRDVASMVEPEKQKNVSVELDCRPLPPLTIRPQQISAVFSNLLHAAIDLAPENGHVLVSSRQVNSRVEVRVEENGEGLAPDQLAHAFEPGFRVKGGRVGSGNWGLFSSRQIVREHGGDVSVDSAPGRGTGVTVTLPRHTNLDRGRSSRRIELS